MIPFRRRRRIVPDVAHSPHEFEYEMVALRQMEQDSMMWQTPSIAFTAQAFLLTIALTPTSGLSGRLIASALGILVALLSINLMAKHRALATIDAARMVWLEKKIGIGKVADRDWPAKDLQFYGKAPKQSRGRRGSYRNWILGLWVFVLANVLSAVLAMTTAAGWI